MGRARGVWRGAGGGADAAKACAQVQPFLPAGGAAQEGEAAPAGRPADKSRVGRQRAFMHVLSAGV